MTRRVLPLAACVTLVAWLAACAPKSPVGDPVAPSVGDTPPPSSSTYWMGEIQVREQANSAVAGRWSDAHTKTLVITLPPSQSQDGLLAQPGNWEMSAHTESTINGDCNPFTGVELLHTDTHEGSGAGGPKPDGFAGSVPVRIAWVPDERTGNGYLISSSWAWYFGDVPKGIGAKRVIYKEYCPRVGWPSSTEVSYNEYAIPVPELRTIKVPSPTDDRFVLEDHDVTAVSSDTLTQVASYRLRRADCTGVPDSDSDGFDDCAEFDAGTDWEDRSSRPSSLLDTDGDGVADPQDWCPREGGLVVPLVSAPGCLVGRGPQIADIVPLDWKGTTDGYKVGFDANRWQTLADNSKVSGFPYAKSSQFTWNFGDGHVETFDAGHAGDVTHTYARGGSYPVSLKVTDPTGRTFTQQTTLEFTGDPLVDFAPEVRFHPDESHFPMDPADYLSFSDLVWREPVVRAWNGQCETQDTTVASPPHSYQIGEVTIGEPYFGSYSLCSDPSLGYVRTASQFTRPNDNSGPRGGLPVEAGFFLDFDMSRDQRSFSFKPAWTERTDRSGTWFFDVVNTYWFFYGYNDAPGPSIADPFVDHEGDWEHFNVHLNPLTHVPGDLGFGYFQHNGGEQAKRRSDIMFAGWLHPVVYSALGSHASYPATGNEVIPLPLLPDCVTLITGIVDTTECVYDLSADSDDVWQTWQNRRPGLPDVKTQGWYGYGGAWGAATSFKDSTGPTGPSPYKSPL